ncbi:MAG: hypothetical protein U5R14_05650 [Gemmatimonadota bacterium]|nr:hypothetical protein [Gemmatimonadota bacterium]
MRVRRTVGSIAAGLVVVLCLGAAPSPAGGQASGEGETNRLVREAAVLEANGDLVGAESLLRRALDRAPDATGAVFALERVLRAQDDSEEIIPVLEEYLGRNPSSGEVRALKLRVLVEVDSVDAVRREADAWIDEDPSSATYRSLAELYENAFGPAEALALLRKGQDEVEEGDALALEVGDLAARLGDRDEAIRQWTRGVGDDGARVAAVARRLRGLPDPRDDAVQAVLSSLSESPIFARRRAAALMALELGMEAEALALGREVADELGTRARNRFLTEVAERARERALGGVAVWAFGELAADADIPTERRSFDQRLVEVALATGDSTAAFEAQSRIAQSHPEESPERRTAAARALRLGMSVLDADALRRAFEEFEKAYPTAAEMDGLAAGVARSLRARGDAEAALSVLAPARGPESRVERAYLLLGEGRTEEGRTVLSEAVEGLPPSEATEVIRLMGLLGRLPSRAASVLGQAAAEARTGRIDEAVGLLEEAADGLDEDGRATLFAHGARMVEDAGYPDRAATVRERLMDEHPDHPATSAAALALARYYAGREGGVDRAVTLLEELISSRPNGAIVPNARAELDRIRRAP